MCIVRNLLPTDAVGTEHPGCTQAKPNWLRFFVPHGIHEIHGKSVRFDARNRLIGVALPLCIPRIPL